MSTLRNRAECALRATRSAVCLLALAACAHAPEPRIVVQKVEVPVSIPCAVEVGPEPEYADNPAAIRAAADIFERAKLILAARAQRIVRIDELAAAMAGCK